MKLPEFITQARENLVEKPWGGNWIPKLKGLEGDKIGESWEFSAHPSNPSYVLIYDKHVSLIDVFSTFKREILGVLADRYDRFPILVKLLDIRDKISVQVHPSDEVAKEFNEGDIGKEEGWIALSEGVVYIGLREDLIPEEIDKIVEKLNKFDAKFLDSFKIPAGIPHFAEGIRLFEVSANSNITYRIHDFYGRKPDLEKALKALNFRKTSESDIRDKKGKISMKNFIAEVLEVEGVREFKIDTFNIVMSLDGDITLKGREQKIEVRRGYSCLIPASTREYSIEGDKALIIRTYPLR